MTLCVQLQKPQWQENIKSLLGNREAQFTGLDGFSHGDTWRWVDVHVCVCLYPCLCVCSCFDILTIDVLHFF